MPRLNRQYNLGPLSLGSPIARILSKIPTSQFQPCSLEEERSSTVQTVALKERRYNARHNAVLGELPTL